MKTIAALLQEKGSEVFTVTSETSVFDALQVLAEKNVGALLVTDEERLSGIFSERDYARKVALQGRSSRDIPVSAIMTERLTCMSPEQNLNDCMAVMTQKDIRHLPVLEEGRLVGIISIGDVVKGVISEQEFIIEQLENYIMGTR